MRHLILLTLRPPSAPICSVCLREIWLNARHLSRGRAHVEAQIDCSRMLDGTHNSMIAANVVCDAASYLIGINRTKMVNILFWIGLFI